MRNELWRPIGTALSGFILGVYMVQHEWPWALFALPFLAINIWTDAWRMAR